jgi:hypothetical protein
MYMYTCTVVSRVSAHGRLTKLANLARMGVYPGYKLHTFVLKLLHCPHEIRQMGAHMYLGVGACPGIVYMYVYAFEPLQFG